MVYNAMKLFMEVNPQLFDECSHEYTEQQNNAELIKANRQAKWDRLTQLAESMKRNGNATGGNVADNNPAKSTTPGHVEDGDTFGQDNQQRMERLRLQDDRDRRNKEYGTHGNSVR